MKLHLDAAVLVGEDLLSLRPDYRGKLNTLHRRNRSYRWRPVRQVLGHAGELIAVGPVLISRMRADGLLRLMLDAGQDKLPVVRRVAREVEGMSRGKTGVATVRLDANGPRSFLLHADSDIALVLVEDPLEMA